MNSITVYSLDVCWTVSRKSDGKLGARVEFSRADSGRRFSYYVNTLLRHYSTGAVTPEDQGLCLDYGQGINIDGVAMAMVRRWMRAERMGEN